MRSAETNFRKSTVDDVDFAPSRGRPARSAVLVLAVLVLACVLGPTASPAGAAPMRGERSDDMRETITLLMLTRMKNELGLSQQQYEQVVPRVEERERSRQANFRSRRERLNKLREILAREGTKDSEFTEAVEGILALDEADRRLDESFVSDMRHILTPRQQGQLVIFRQRFRQWIEGRMRDAQEIRRRFGRPGPPVRGGASAGGAPGEGTDGSGSETPDRP